MVESCEELDLVEILKHLPDLTFLKLDSYDKRNNSARDALMWLVSRTTHDAPPLRHLTLELRGWASVPHLTALAASRSNVKRCGTHRAVQSATAWI